jgi:hypothetical protein
VKVKQRVLWAAYFDVQHGQTSIMTDPGDRGIVQELLKNKRYSREELVTAVRNNTWRQRKQCMVTETSKLPLTRKQKDT